MPSERKTLIASFLTRLLSISGQVAAGLIIFFSLALLFDSSLADWQKATITIVPSLILAAIGRQLRGFCSKIILSCLLAALLGVGLQSVLLDGIAGTFLSMLQDRAETQYSNGYSTVAFRLIPTGLSRRQVVKVLGRPLSEVWFYLNRGGSCNERFIFIAGHITGSAARVALPPELTPEDLVQARGEPCRSVMNYSTGANSYSVRELVLEKGTVSDKVSYYYVD